MQHVSTRAEFYERAKAAPIIFSYVLRDSKLRPLRLEFDYGLVNEVGTRAVAKFSAFMASGSQRTNVWVSATTAHDGS